MIVGKLAGELPRFHSEEADVSMVITGYKYGHHRLRAGISSGDTTHLRRNNAPNTPAPPSAASMHPTYNQVATQPTHAIVSQRCS